MSKMTSVLFSRKMLVMLFLGFSSGLPYLVTKDIIKAWLTDSNVDLATIGLFSAVGLPYTYKFIWSPFVDRFSLISFLGRRRSWMIVTQVCLLLLIAALGFANPNNHMTMLTVFAVSIAFFSATQDIVLDAYRRDYLDDNELGLGTGIWVNAYRGANLLSVGLGFIIADKLGYTVMFTVIASMMGVGIIATLMAPEPTTSSQPRNFKEAVIDPFSDFFTRKGALWVLGFILLYKLGDNMASAMNVTYILKHGYTKTEYFVIVKGLGMTALFGGMFLGGMIMIKLGIIRSLVIFGVLQMISTFCFAFIAYSPEKNLTLLSAIVVFELLSTGLGQTAYAAFMALQTNRKFTATQYALMTSLMAIPGTVAAATTGYLVEWVDWGMFYLICSLVALPGIGIIWFIRNNKNLASA